MAAQANRTREINKTIGIYIRPRSLSSASADSMYKNETKANE